MQAHSLRYLASHRWRVCEVQPADDPDLKRKLVVLPGSHGANHEDPAARFPEFRPGSAAWSDGSYASAARDGNGGTTSHRLRVGWASVRRVDSRNCAELLRACAI